MQLYDDSRAAWGAAAPSGTINTVTWGVKTEVFWHYVDGTPLGLADNPHTDCLRKVKAFQTFHMGPSRGWNDIGYNALICQHGRVIEGRGFQTVGAHCPDHNRQGIGVQFMVGGLESPTPAAYRRAVRLLAELTTTASHTFRVLGHRDGVATACPGSVIYGWLRAGMPVESLEAPQPPVVVVPVETPTAPTPPKVTGLIAEDGLNGPTTRKAIQRMLGVTADGSWGPTTRKAIQKWAGVKQDGSIGPATRTAVQRKLGIKATGVWAWDQSTRPDVTTKALQAFYNRTRRNLAA